MNSIIINSSNPKKIAEILKEKNLTYIIVEASGVGKVRAFGLRIDINDFKEILETKKISFEEEL